MIELASIVDVLKNADGSLASGRLVITPSIAFTAADGSQISAAPIEYRIVDGTVNLSLAPTEGSDPAATYRAEYFLQTRCSETWNVPRAGGPFTIFAVRGGS